MNGFQDASLGRYGNKKARAPFLGGDQGHRGNGRKTDLRLRERLVFLGAFLCRPGRLGAISPSSEALSRAMLQGCDLAKTSTLVELGPGTGSLTSVILENIPQDCTFIPVELDPVCITQLARRFPQLKVHHESAAQLPCLLRKQGKSTADCILSGLPWASMPLNTQREIFDAVIQSLPPGGVFRTFAYIHASWFPSANRFRQLLEANFSSVRKSPIIWKNLPPAFVYECVR